MNDIEIIYNDIELYIMILVLNRSFNGLGNVVSRFIC